MPISIGQKMMSTSTQNLAMAVSMRALTVRAEAIVMMVVVTSQHLSPRLTPRLDQRRKRRRQWEARDHL